jgi:hypothetical protein
MIMGTRIRRVVAAVALTIGFSAGMVAAGGAQAFACSDSSHCYAYAVNGNSASNHGVFGELYVDCLYPPDVSGDFANNEIWDTTSSRGNWVEGGIKSGVDYHGVYRNKDWFWADQRPGDSYAEHDTSVAAATGEEWPVEITYAGTNTWDVYGEGDFTEFGTSTSDTANLVTGIGGTEYTTNASSGIRDIGNVYSLENGTTGGSWYSWGGDGSNVDQGSGNYISSSYNSGGSYESWSGPC